MLRGSLVSLIAIALLVTPPAFAKGGNGGGHGGGNAGGGKDGGGGRGHGNGGGQGQGNSGGNGNRGDSGNRGGGGGHGKEDNGSGSQSHGRGGNGGTGHQGDTNAGSSGKGGGSAKGNGSGRAGVSGSARGGVGAASGGSPKGSGKTTVSPPASTTNTITGNTSVKASSPAVSQTRAMPVSALAAVRAGGTGLNLPSSLIPLIGPSRSGRPGSAEPLIARAGISGQIVQVCRAAIATAALPFGAIRVDTVSAGRAVRMPDGGLTAPIEARIVYARASARQIRQSRVACRMNAAGTVVALR